jgi:hypothetical protein
LQFWFFTAANVKIGQMMQAASTYEVSADFYQTARRSNPEDSHLQLQLF